jgi:hypothetical protein
MVTSSLFKNLTFSNVVLKCQIIHNYIENYIYLNW